MDKVHGSMIWIFIFSSFLAGCSPHDPTGQSELMKSMNDLAWYAPLKIDITNRIENYYKVHGKWPKDLGEFLPPNGINIHFRQSGQLKMLTISKANFSIKLRSVGATETTYTYDCSLLGMDSPGVWYVDKPEVAFGDDQSVARTRQH